VCLLDFRVLPAGGVGGAKLPAGLYWLVASEAFERVRGVPPGRARSGL
jgi:hypothetical protein